MWQRYTERHSLLEMTRFWPNLPDSSQGVDVEIASLFLCHPSLSRERASVFIGKRKLRANIPYFMVTFNPLRPKTVVGQLTFQFLQWAFLTEKVFIKSTIPVKSCFSNYEMWSVTRCVRYTQLRYYFRLKRVNYLLGSESLTAQDTSRHLLVKVSIKIELH